MNILQQIEFLNKWYFIIFLFLPIIIYLFYRKEKKWINFIYLQDIKKIFKWNNYKFYLKILLLILIFINFIILLANPNKVNVSQKIKKNGIDIILALDISGSMEAEDLQPNRIEAAKKVINNFISNLKTDRLWLVVFAWKPFTSIPLTFDYNILTETISRLGTQNINQRQRWLSWTAIWDAILMSKTLFKDSDEIKKKEEEREKVIILLTDWDANIGVDPVLAGTSAKKEGIKIYTIWIGSEKWWVITYNDWFFDRQAKIPPLNDEDLKKIALNTWWKYFRADNNNTFEEVFKELSKLEKSDLEIEIQKEYSEYYNIFIYSLVFLLTTFTYLILSNIQVKQKNNNILK